MLNHFVPVNMPSAVDNFLSSNNLIRSMVSTAINLKSPNRLLNRIISTYINRVQVTTHLLQAFLYMNQSTTISSI